MTLNVGEKPRVPIITKLSDVLEEDADPKYQLSPKACRGILNRAAKRGKELPPELREALEAQADEPQLDAMDMAIIKAALALEPKADENNADEEFDWL